MKQLQGKQFNDLHAHFNIRMYYSKISEYFYRQCHTTVVADSVRNPSSYPLMQVHMVHVNPTQDIELTRN